MYIFKALKSKASCACTANRVAQKSTEAHRPHYSIKTSTAHSSSSSFPLSLTTKAVSQSTPIHVPSVILTASPTLFLSQTTKAVSHSTPTNVSFSASLETLSRSSQTTTADPQSNAPIHVSTNASTASPTFSLSQTTTADPQSNAPIHVSTNASKASPTFSLLQTTTADPQSNAPIHVSTNASTASPASESSSYTSATMSSSKTLTTDTSTKKTSTPTMTYDDCDDAWSKGVRVSGPVHIQPAGLRSSQQVFCRMSSTGGWIVIQRRKFGNISFDNSWEDYKRGFGELNGDFWIGNELIYKLTSKSRHNKLFISLGDWSGRSTHAQYTDFRLESESEGYRLYVGSYSGDAGDSFNYRQSVSLRHTHMKFSTKDRDNDPQFFNCARTLHAGWWFNRCYSSNLNGPYLQQPYGHRSMGEMYGNPTLEGTGVEWYPWKRRQYSLKATEMMLKLGSG